VTCSSASTAQWSTAGIGYLFDVDVDGAAVGGNDGLMRVRGTDLSDTIGVNFIRLVSGLAAGEHIFKLQWKTGAATATLLAGAGTSGKMYIRSSGSGR